MMTADGVGSPPQNKSESTMPTTFTICPDDAAFMIDDRLAIRSASDFGDYCYHITQGVNAMVNTPVYDFFYHMFCSLLLMYHGANLMTV